MDCIRFGVGCQKDSVTDTIVAEFVFVLKCLMDRACALTEKITKGCKVAAWSLEFCSFLLASIFRILTVRNTVVSSGLFDFTW